MADFYVDDEWGVTQRADKPTNKEMPDPQPGAPLHRRFFRLIRFMSEPTFEGTWRPLSADEVEELPDEGIGLGPFPGNE